MNIILDTDIGSDIDDAMALLLCLRLRELSLRAVTTVYGDVGTRAKIAKKLVNLAQCEVPVAMGECAPMSSPISIWDTGREGEGILDEGEFWTSATELGIQSNAAELMTRTAAECPGNIDIVAIGPLTNVAKAIQTDPAFKTHVRRIWAMIGGIAFPDDPPDRPLVLGEAYCAKPSHNVRCDVEAARIVLESGIPLVMVGNDVTTRVRIDLDGIAEIQACEDPLSDAVIRMMRVWLEYRARVFGRPVTWTCLHDALVVAEACGKSFTEQDHVLVEVFDCGTSIVRADPSSTIAVCRTVEKDRFERWYMDVCTGVSR
jgi:purine nucleosidase